MTGIAVRKEHELAVVIGAGAMSIAVARKLGRNCQRLLLADINQERLLEQGRNLAADGIDVVPVVCDVTDADSVRNLAERVAREGSVSALAHVAGLSPSMADWRTIMAVNLVGPALVTGALMPHIKAGGAGVLVASVSAYMHQPDPAVQAALANPLAANFLDGIFAAAKGDMNPQMAYVLSKYGVIALCRRLAPSWGQRGVRIVSLSPGLIASPQGALEFKSSTAKHGLLEKCPLQRQGTMDEIAEVVDFLLSARASYIHGTDLLVDGGVLAAVAAEQA